MQIRLLADALSNHWEKIDGAPDDPTAFSRRLPLILDLLKKTMTEISEEINNPDSVNRKSKEYLQARSEGIELTFSFFQSELAHTAHRLTFSETNRNRNRDSSRYINSITLEQVRLMGMQTALFSLQLPELNKILQDYAEKLESLKARFPAPRFFTNPEFRGQVSVAADILGLQRVEFTRNLAIAFSLFRMSIMRGWSSPAGSCEALFKMI